MSAGMRCRLAAMPISCAAVALAGCTSLSARAQDSSLAALTTMEPKPRAAYTDLRGTKACRSAQPFKSLPPLRRLPRAGHMPDGTWTRTIQERGHLLVGADQNSLRLGFFNPLRSPPAMEGFDADLAREIARAIFGNPDDIRFIAISTGQRSAVIVKQQVDLVASAYSINCSRRRRMLFSSVYHRAQQRLLVPRNSTITRLSQLAGRKVCVTTASTSGGALKGSGVVPYRVPLRSDCLAALQEGDVAAITSDDAILYGFQLQDPSTTIVGPSIECERWGMAINRRRLGFVRFVNAVLARLRRSGVAERIRRHWLGKMPRTTAGVAC
jgi:polar amino acid transport system substrate-binding protein